MILSRIKPAIKKPSSDGDGAGGAEAAGPATSTSSAGLQTKAMPKLEEFLEKRDYTGAMTLLEFNRSSGKGGDLGCNSIDILGEAPNPYPNHYRGLRHILTPSPLVMKLPTSPYPKS